MRCPRCRTVCSDDDVRCAACRTRLDAAAIGIRPIDSARRAARLGMGFMAVGAAAGPVFGGPVPLIPTYGAAGAANLILWSAVGAGIGAAVGYALGFGIGWVKARAH